MDTIKTGPKLDTCDHLDSQIKPSSAPSLGAFNNRKQIVMSDMEISDEIRYTLAPLFKLNSKF